MDSARYRRIRELYHELCERSPQERRAALEALELDAESLTELEALLEHHPGELFNARPFGSIGRDLADQYVDDAEDAIPARIGDYKIQRKIGEGGMGVVYAGHRKDSDTTVALKLIRPIFAGADVLKRFQREAGVLRRLKHVGIAAYFDSGEAVVRVGVESLTLPFLAMELVDGISLGHHARAEALGDRERLELMARVCDAVQHAHEQGVVHRDLKPGNVLVVSTKGDPIGQPKVLDFGIARATGVDIHTMTATHSGAVIGTLPYMSPEQVSGRRSAVDARSDVYSLGVMLFELLVERLPCSVQGKSIPEAARIIEEDEPTRLGSVAGRLRGPVEVIVSKALEKDPARRYAAAADFARDLRNCLAGGEIEARPATWSHQLGKFARRHRVLVGTLCGTFAALLIGLLTTLKFAFGEADARVLADESARASKWLAYRMGIDGASADLIRHDVVRASERLELVPREHIGWEWHHLRSRLDQSLHRVELEGPVERVRQIVFSPDGGKLHVVHDSPDGSFMLQSLALRDSTVEVRPLPGAPVPAIDPTGTRLYMLDEERETLTVESLEGDRTSRISLPAVSHFLVSREPGRLAVFRGNEWAFLDPSTNQPGVALSVGAKYSKRNLDRVSLSFDGLRLAWLIDTVSTKEIQVRGRALTESWTIPDQRSELRTILSPRGKYLAVFSIRDRFIETWELSPGEPPEFLCAFRGHLDEVNTLAFSPNGEIIASGGDDSLVRVWDVRTGSERLLLPHFGRTVTRIAFSSDGNLVAAVIEDSGEHEALVWPVNDEEERTIASDVMLRSVGFTKSGSRILVGSENSVLLFDADTGFEIARYRCPFPVLMLEASPDGRWIVAGFKGSRDHGITLIDTFTGDMRVLTEAQGKTRSGGFGFSFSPSGHRLATCPDDRGVVLWDTSEWTVVANQPEVAPVGARVRFGPSGDWLAVSGMVPGTEESPIILLGGEDLSIRATLNGHQKAVSAMSFHPDGTQLVTGGGDQTVRVWSLTQLGQSRVLPSRCRQVFSLAHSPDGQRLAVGGQQRSFHIWATDEHTEITALHGHHDAVRGVAFAPDGKRLVSVSGDRTLRVWDQESTPERLRKRQEYREARALLEPRVDELVTASGPVEAAELLSSDDSLSERSREIALQLIVGLGAAE